MLHFLLNKTYFAQVKFSQVSDDMYAKNRLMLKKYEL